MPGIGGGGGGPPLGGGGGGAGGALPAPNAPGIGGAGGGDMALFIDEGGGDMVDGGGELSPRVSSLALIGLGGAMVPKSMLASCFALPLVGLASSSSSSEEPESTTDQSSSSGRRREVGPVGCTDRGGRV